MCLYAENTEKKALFELAKALKHFIILDDSKMNPGDRHTAEVAEKLVRGIIEDNGYTERLGHPIVPVPQIKNIA